LQYQNQAAILLFRIMMSEFPPSYIPSVTVPYQINYSRNGVGGKQWHPYLKSFYRFASYYYGTNPNSTKIKINQLRYGAFDQPVRGTMSQGQSTLTYFQIRWNQLWWNEYGRNFNERS
jgi:hypothetical protein